VQHQEVTHEHIYAQASHIFTSLFFAVTSFSTANAQLLDTFDDQFSSSTWEVVNNLLDATTADIGDILGVQIFEDPATDLQIGFIILGLDTPIGSFQVYGLGNSGQDVVYLGPAELSEDEIVLTGDDAQEFLDRLRAAERRGDITITTTLVDVTVEPPNGTVTITSCIETVIFGCITIRRTTR
jgi:hypothetical protein